MLLTILAISILMIIGGFLFENKAKSYSEAYESLEVTGFVISVIVGIAILIMSIVLSIYSTSEDKTVLYEEENTRIETTINDIAESYKSYEQKTFDKITSPEVLIQTYPELKSSELVQTQMQTYLENRKKIIELKEKTIENDVFRWWIYFGGK